MAEFINTLLFGIFPYIALTVLVVGSIIRYDHEPYSWRANSSQLLRRKQLIWGSVLFHVGILVIFAGHFVGLLTPIAIWDALGVPHGAKQLLAVIAGGIAGVFCLIGLVMLLHRRLTDSRIRKTSSFWDIGILVLLLAQLLLGLGTIFVSLNHLDGHTMVLFMNWAFGVVTFQPDIAGYILHAPLIFKLHIVLGLTIFAVFPFTRLVHMFSAPVRYLWRPGYQVVRSRGRAKAQSYPAE
ncbi:MAG: respiratory nitrate reductase subunit gamma [Sphingomonadales bacterium]|nr:MAG: respiratory nitrate reductase subunit gamma [Sphingomonadales bacterium]